jgi:hypothetical protein
MILDFEASSHSGTSTYGAATPVQVRMERFPRAPARFWKPLFQNQNQKPKLFLTTSPQKVGDPMTHMSGTGGCHFDS